MARANRPLSRSLVKIGTRIFLGNSRAHVQDWFPGLKLNQPSAGQPGMIRYRQAAIAPLWRADILRQEAGPRIYLVGSGPSIAESDVTRMEPSSAILLNGAIHLIGSGIAAPLAVAIEDERFVWRHFDLMKDKIAPQTICLLSVAVIRAICERGIGWLYDKRIVLIDDIRRPYGLGRRSLAEIRDFSFVRLNEAGSAGLSLDPARGVFQGGSVAISALQFAFYCSPELIGILGIDISNASQPRFYESGQDMAYSGIARAEERILDYFALARTIAAEKGVALRNHSSVSALAKVGLAYDDRFARTSANDQ